MTPLENMWFSFIGLGLMFVSVVLALFGKSKLSGILRFIVMSFSFVCLVIAGIITFIIVIQGPTADY
ncbi:uncharacterized protein DUF2768 [Salsuginibacillus halophilus]|uniref:Uncharacterized protein DUF2768 n=1 Tax=Salsuginibacillus halophilus TaxID=517424 RepID=A0A2P8HWE1_9BACI|nr:DUF2768 domain-containing protein [Salsuginibacillus halophilus]PSL50485.1 uncharacterized protein DUF2768 [Salsuginibacillus halophilus]